MKEYVVKAEHLDRLAMNLESQEKNLQTVHERPHDSNPEFLKAMLVHAELVNHFNMLADRHEQPHYQERIRKKN